MYAKGRQYVLFEFSHGCVEAAMYVTEYSPQVIEASHEHHLPVAARFDTGASASTTCR